MAVNPKRIPPTPHCGKPVIGDVVVLSSGNRWAKRPTTEVTHSQIFVTPFLILPPRTKVTKPTAAKTPPALRGGYRCEYGGDGGGVLLA